MKNMAQGIWQKNDVKVILNEMGSIPTHPLPLARGESREDDMTQEGIYMIPPFYRTRTGGDDYVK